MKTIETEHQQTETIRDSLYGSLVAQPANINAEIWHVINERDNVLINDQILHGYVDQDFIYAFLAKGKLISGVSVIGAKELAYQYGGIKARVVATTEKRGAMFIFKQYSPMTIEIRTLRELEDEEDFYECITEIFDVKNGNSIQVRKKELRREKDRNGDFFTRPHFDVIAESKAYRNGVLSLLPQHVIGQFERKCLNAALMQGAFNSDQTLKRAVESFISAPRGQNVSQEKTIQQLREGVIAHAAKQALMLDKQAVNLLSYAEIVGLGQTVKDAAEFKKSCLSLGLMQPIAEPQKIATRGRPRKENKYEVVSQESVAEETLPKINDEEFIPEERIEVPAFLQEKIDSNKKTSEIHADHNTVIGSGISVGKATSFYTTSQTPNDTQLISESILKILLLKLEQAALSTNDFALKWGKQPAEVANAEINDIFKWISNPS